jgi:ribosomal protein S8
LNLALSRKKLFIKIKYTKKTLKLVKVLHKIGYLNSFSITTQGDQHSHIYLSPSFFKSTPFFKSIRLVSTPSKKHYTSLKALKTFDKTLKSSILILSTPQGLIGHKEALKMRTGGTIVCIAS